jgi:hypothetical protein
MHNRPRLIIVVLGLSALAVGAAASPAAQTGVSALVPGLAGEAGAPPGAALPQAAFASFTPESGPAPTASVGPLFPEAYFTEYLDRAAESERARPYWVPSETEAAAESRLREDLRPVLLNDDVLAFYGSPNSKRMGILGAYPLPELGALLDQWAAAYDAANGGRGIKKAFYIIYGTVWPEGEIGLLKESRLIEYIEYAQAHGILVFVDHQIGRYSVPEAMNAILPFLRYPNVHLALDPEWRTTKPMEEIGSVTAAEINEAQRMMEDYIVERGLPGERLLVVHQFNYKMILEREAVRADFRRVRLIHCADGFGIPAVKRAAYNYNARAENMPMKGFKLFFPTEVKGAGYDTPLLSPEEVFALTPRPYVIMYQ